jgi:hypothetical protein
MSRKPGDFLVPSVLQVWVLFSTSMSEFVHNPDTANKQIVVTASILIVSFALNWVAYVFVPWRIRHAKSAAIGLYEAVFRYGYYQHAIRQTALVINFYLVGRNISMYSQNCQIMHIFDSILALVTFALWVRWTWDANGIYRKQYLG